MGARRSVTPGGVTRGEDVALRELAIGPEIGDGGQGRVYRIRGNKNLLYKCYKAPGAIDGGALGGLVALHQKLAVPERRWIDRHCAWPMCRVVDGGRAVGFLMRRAAREFTWSAEDGARLNQLQYFTRAPKPAWRQVPQPEPEQRRQLALAYAALILRLHRWGTIVGDVSELNLLCRLRPEPDVYLLDCDGVRLRGSPPVTAQANTPEWEDPLTPGPPTFDSDRYKSALVIGRLLARDPSLRPGQSLVCLPGALSLDAERAAARLFAQAAGARGTRPSLEQWAEALGQAGAPLPPPLPLAATGSAASRTPGADGERPRPQIPLFLDGSGVWR